MRFRPKKTESRLIRPIPALIALLAGAGVSAAIALGASTEVGQTTSAPVQPVGAPVVAASTVPGSRSYSTPDGVLTSWRFHSSSDAPAGAIKLEVFRRVGPANKYLVEAESSLKSLDPDTAYEFNERIPVKQGALLGLAPQGTVKLGIDAPGSQNRVGAFNGGDIPVGMTGTTTTELPDRRLSVAATVEPDADHDGYGDLSQDGCPTDPKRQDPCPDKRAPALILSGSSRQNVVAKRAVFVTVKSDENGTATGKGTLSVPGASRVFKLKSATKSVTAGRKAKFKLRLSRKGLRAAKRSLRRGKRVRAKTTVAISDAAGNIGTAKRTVRAKRPKRH